MKFGTKGEMLTDTNWSAWSHSIWYLLGAHGLNDYAAKESHLIEKYTLQKDIMASLTIIKNIPADLASRAHARRFRTARELYQWIEKIYSRTADSTIVKHRSDLAQAHLVEYADSVAAARKIGEIARHLADLDPDNVERYEQDAYEKLLLWATTCKNEALRNRAIFILDDGAKGDFDDLAARFKVTEGLLKPKNAAKEQKHNLAHAAHSSGSNSRRKGKGKNAGNAAENADRKCWHCDSTEHLRNACSAWLATPDGVKYAQKKAEKAQKAAKPSGTNSGGSETNSGSNNTQQAANPGAWAVAHAVRTTAMHATAWGPTDWILDSGADYHYVNDRSWFTELWEVPPDTIEVANRQHAVCTQKGNIEVTLRSLAGAQSLKLKNVYYMPEFGRNLIAVERLIKARCTTHFELDYYSIRRSGEDIVRLPTRRPNGVKGFPIHVERTTGAKPFAGITIAAPATSAADHGDRIVTQADQSLLWHRRLAHGCEKHLSRLYEKVEGLPGPLTGVPKMTETGPHCEICIKSKMVHVYNRSQPRRVTELLGRVHSDLWGPARYAGAATGDRYWVLFIDEKSRLVLGYTLRQKSDAASAFSFMKAYLERQSEQRIKALRTDNGSEYATIDFNNLGIAHETSSPYCHTENGTAERHNRIINSSVRCMLLEAGAPPKYWDLAFKAAIYVRN